MSDPTRFVERGFTWVENKEHSVRLIDRNNSNQAISIAWADLPSLRELIVLALGDDKIKGTAIPPDFTEQVGTAASWEDEARRLLTACCYIINGLADQQAMPDNSHEQLLKSIGNFLQQPRTATSTSLTEQAQKVVEDWKRTLLVQAAPEANRDLIRRIALFASEAATGTVAKYFCDDHQKSLSESKAEKFVCFWCAQNKIAEREAEAATQGQTAIVREINNCEKCDLCEDHLP